MSTFPHAFGNSGDSGRFSPEVFKGVSHITGAFRTSPEQRTTNIMNAAALHAGGRSVSELEAARHHLAIVMCSRYSGQMAPETVDELQAQVVPRYVAAIGATILDGVDQTLRNAPEIERLKATREVGQRVVGRETGLRVQSLDGAYRTIVSEQGNPSWLMRKLLHLKSSLTNPTFPSDVLLKDHVKAMVEAKDIPADTVRARMRYGDEAGQLYSNIFGDLCLGEALTPKSEVDNIMATALKGVVDIGFVHEQRAVHQALIEAGVAT